jgi:hypothetical protein
MGGGPNPADFISKPDFTVPAAELAMQSDIGRRALESRSKLLDYASKQPLESWTPDIFGEQGMQTQAAQIAAINAFKNKQLEQQTNPEVAKIREQLPKMIAEDLQPGSWEKQMRDWAKNFGLAQNLSLGTQDSTVGKSALFDAATMQGLALRRAQEEAASRLLGANQQPVAGLDPQSILNMQNTAAIDAMRQRAGFKSGILNAAGGQQQSTTDWLNQMMGSTNQAVESGRKEWKDYGNALYKAQVDKSNQRNALIGAGIGAVGTILGGPMGGAAAGMLAKQFAPQSNPMNQSMDPGYMGDQDGMPTYARTGSSYLGYTAAPNF